MPNQPDAPALLRQARKEMGLTQAQFSKLVGLEQYALSRAECGKEKLSKYMVERICEVTGLKMESLRGLIAGVKPINKPSNAKKTAANQTQPHAVASSGSEATNNADPLAEQEECQSERSTAEMAPSAPGRWVETVLPQDVFNAIREKAEANGRLVSVQVAEIVIEHVRNGSKTEAKRAEMKKGMENVIASLRLACETAIETYNTIDGGNNENHQ